MSFHKVCIGALVVGLLAACGNGGNSSADSAASAAASAAAAAPSAVASAGAVMASAAGNAMTAAGGAMQSAGSAMSRDAKWMNKTAAPVPADLNCGAVQPVWVNTKTHKYHEPSSPMYGKTKDGKYMCPSAAKAEGDTAAGGWSGKHRHSSDSSGT